MRTKVAVSAAILVVLVSTMAIYLWNPFTWKPRPKDVVMLNGSGSAYRPSASIILYIDYYDRSRACYEWRWTIEFWLENRYKEDLDLDVEIERYSDELDDWFGGFTTSGVLEVSVPSGGKRKIELGMDFSTGSKDIIPHGLYRVMARTQLERKTGVEMKRYDFEWVLVSGWVNRTTRTYVPDNIPEG